MPDTGTGRHKGDPSRLNDPPGPKPTGGRSQPSTGPTAKTNKPHPMSGDWCGTGRLTRRLQRRIAELVAGGMDFGSAYQQAVREPKPHRYPHPGLVCDVPDCPGRYVFDPTVLPS